MSRLPTRSTGEEVTNVEEDDLLEQELALVARAIARTINRTEMEEEDERTTATRTYSFGA